MNRKQTCPVCAGSSFTVHSEGRMFRTAKGEELPYAVEYSKCEQCGEEFYTRQQTRAASRAAVGAERKHRNRLAPSEITAIRSQYDVTQEEAEVILGFGKKSFSRWESGRVCPSHAADHLLREVRSSPAMFERMAGQAGVVLQSKHPVWAWDTPNYEVIFTNVILPATTEVSVRRRPGPLLAAEVDPTAVDWAGYLGTTITINGIINGARVDQTNGSSGPERFLVHT